MLETQGITAFSDVLTSRQSLLLGSNLGRIRKFKRVVAFVFSTPFLSDTVPCKILENHD